MKEVKLKRLEIDQSKKQLGIFSPINGNVEQERQHKYDQCKELGERLYRLPLNYAESMIVYKMYFIPRIRYPLSIKHFTQESCNAM